MVTIVLCGARTIHKKARIDNAFCGRAACSYCIDYMVLQYLNHFSFITGIKCPVCNKFVLPDDIECHLVMCLTKPRLSYNGNAPLNRYKYRIILIININIHIILQRIHYWTPKASALFVLKTWVRVIQLLDCHVSASTTKGELFAIYRIYFIPKVISIISCSCIDRWFEVNRSCPEHPGD